MWTLGFIGVPFACAVPCRAHSVADLDSGGQFVFLLAFMLLEVRWISFRVASGASALRMPIA